MKRIIQLNEDDIKEIKNIVELLKSNDEESFKLGRSLFETRFPVNSLLIPFYQYFVSIQPYWNEMCLCEFDSIPMRQGHSNVLKLLYYLTYFKHYALPSNK